MERRAPGLAAELVVVLLVLGCLGGSLGLVLAMHRRGAAPRRPGPDPVVVAAPPTPTPDPPAEPARPAPPKADPPPAEPAEDPTPKALAELAGREAAERSAAEAAEREAASLETARRAALARAARSARRVALARTQVDRLEAKARALEAEAEILARERDALVVERDATRADIQRARLKAGAANSYAIVPYKGTNGTWRRPIPIECREGQATLMPHGPTYSLLDLAMGPRLNPLGAAVLMATAQLRRQAGPDGSAIEPFVLFLIRPDGVRAYYEARVRIEALGVPFGYELVDDDWEIDYPEIGDPSTWLDGESPRPARPGAALAGDPAATGGPGIEPASAFDPRPGDLAGTLRDATAGWNRPVGGAGDGRGDGSGGLAGNGRGGLIGDGLGGGPDGPRGMGARDGLDRSPRTPGGPYGGGVGGSNRLGPGGSTGGGLNGLNGGGRGDQMVGGGRDGTPGRGPAVAGGGAGTGTGLGTGTGPGTGRGGNPRPGDPWAEPSGRPPLPGPSLDQAEAQAGEVLAGSALARLAGASPGGRGGVPALEPTPPTAEGGAAGDPTGLAGARGGMAGSGSGSGSTAGLKPLNPGSRAAAGAATAGSGPRSGPSSSAPAGSSPPGRGPSGGAAGEAGPGLPGDGQGMPRPFPPLAVAPTAGGQGRRGGSGSGGGSGRGQELAPGVTVEHRPDQKLELVVACGASGVTVHPGGYALDKATLDRKDGPLPKTLRSIVNHKQGAEPDVTIRPEVRFLIEPGGEASYWSARRQTVLAGLGWPTSFRVTEGNPLRAIAAGEGR